MTHTDRNMKVKQKRMYTHVHAIMHIHTCKTAPSGAAGPSIPKLHMDSRRRGAQLAGAARYSVVASLPSRHRGLLSTAQHAADSACSRGSMWARGRAECVAATVPAVEAKALNRPSLCERGMLPFFVVVAALWGEEVGGAANSTAATAAAEGADTV